jgi:heme A synthase
VRIVIYEPIAAVAFALSFVLVGVALSAIWRRDDRTSSIATLVAVIAVTVGVFVERGL